MNDLDRERLGKFLREVVGPVPKGDPHGDLWPRMVRRIEHAEPRLSWTDWAFAALAMGWCAAFPETIFALFYHL